MLFRSGTLRSPITPTLQITTARDATKAVVDFLCPAPVVADSRGSFASGFFQRYTANRQAVELSKQDMDDIKAFTVVCQKAIADRSDFDYGILAGGALDRVTLMLMPQMGKDFFSVMAALGMMVK